MKWTKSTSALVLVALSMLVGSTTALVPTSRSVFQARNVRSQARGGVSMKVFDWKRREADESHFAHVDSVIFDVTNLKPAPGSRKPKTRKGRGISAGQGATCGFGMRGQKSRAGRSVRAGFEGGQNPLYRRSPKAVGKPLGPGHKRKLYNPIKLDLLNGVSDGSTVTFESLREAKLLPKCRYDMHKIVGGGDLTVKDLTVQAHAFTNTAREAIESNGGKCVVISRTTGLPVEVAQE